MNIFKIGWRLILLYALITVIKDQIENSKPHTPSYGSPCENSIDYDWERGVYICPDDTMIWMRHPNQRHWIKKTDYVPLKKRRKTKKLPLTELEELRIELDDRGIE
tara:strand:- start:108 stop:425 length:318 start_codon:yes stop_codon:yes gene_type:complete